MLNVQPQIPLSRVRLAPPDPSHLPPHRSLQLQLQTALHPEHVILIKRKKQQEVPRELKEIIVSGKVFISLLTNHHV